MYTELSASPTGTDLWQLRGDTWEGLISKVWVLVMFVHADQPLSIPDLHISCSIAVLIQRHLTSLTAKIWRSFNVELQISQFFSSPLIFSLHRTGRIASLFIPSVPQWSSALISSERQSYLITIAVAHFLSQSKSKRRVSYPFEIDLDKF